jgi:hypothetical protein
MKTPPLGKPVRAVVTYDDIGDYYTIAFPEKVVSSDSGQATYSLRPYGHDSEADKWSMFTHGVCALRQGNGYDFQQLALTGWHLEQPVTREVFNDRLERAAAKLEFMAEQSERQVVVSVRTRQCRYILGLLNEHREFIIDALMTVKHAEH